MRAAMRVFDFNRAIARTPGETVINGLRAGDQPDPSFDGVLREHAAYLAALRSAGVDVTELPPLPEFPDSMFVEDPALVFPEGAILLRPGAPSREHEAAHLAPELNSHFAEVLDLPEGHADGGDVLRLADRVIIGVSDRTDRTGAGELKGLLAELGYRAEVADTPKSVLHFKTGCGLIDERTVLAVPAMRDCPEFAGLEVVLTPPGEEGAANILRVRDTVLIGERWPATQAMLAARGVPYRALATDHVARLDAGLSCMSLRW